MYVEYEYAEFLFLCAVKPAIATTCIGRPPVLITTFGSPNVFLGHLLLYKTTTCLMRPTTAIFNYFFFSKTANLAHFSTAI